MFARILSTIFTGYIFTIPIARMAMMECYPTLFATMSSVVSTLMTYIVWNPQFFDAVPLNENAILGFFTFVILLLAIYTHHIEIRGPAPEFVDMRGKTVLVTGANSGIGLETARQLMLMGATVVLGCRSMARAKEAYQSLLSTLEPHRSAVVALDESHVNDCTKTVAEGHGNVILLSTPLDLSSVKSVREYVKAYQAEGLGLDTVVWNAGMIPSTYTEIVEERSSGNKDGFITVEGTFAANHLGHHLLVNLLLPLLKESHEKRKTEKPISKYVSVMIITRYNI